MSFVHAVGEQWKKAEYAYQLATFIKQDTRVQTLFVGATDVETVCHVIAALMDEHHRFKNQGVELNSLQVFLALFDCFLLLFVKEIQGGELSQAEQLILTLTRHYAVNLIKDELDELDEGVKVKSERVIIASQQLDELRRKKRNLRSNMR
ncbi:hypothetical protein [Shewanella chilikensis]|uniref:hypothetical protein n=1 Tax=Shewanella chilikensis TaxID=558541 RepID=UPI00399C418C